MYEDRRFPHMIPLDGRHVPGLSPWELKCAVSEGKRVAGRTQTHPFFNLRTGGIFFARGTTPNMGPYEMSLKPLGEEMRRHSDAEIDEIVAYMNLSLVDTRTRDRWTEGHERREAHERESERQRMKEERGPSIVDQMDFLSRKRRGTSKLIAT